MNIFTKFCIFLSFMALAYSSSSLAQVVSLGVPQDLKQPYEQLKAGKYREAVPALNKIISKKPSRLAAIYLRGVVLVGCQSYDSAIVDFNYLVNFAAKSPTSNQWDELSSFTMFTTKYQKVSDSFAADANYWLAQILAQRLKYDESLAKLDLALKKQPKQPAYISYKAEVLLAKGKLTDAAKLFLEVRPYKGYEAYSYKMAGIALAQMTDWKRAGQYLHRAMQANPSWKELNLLSGHAYSEQGIYDTAEMDLLAYQKIAPNDTALLSKLGLLYTRIKRWGQAQATYFSLVKIDPKSGSGWYGYANASVYMEQLNHAEAGYTKAITLGYKRDYAYYNRAILRKRLGQDYCADIHSAAAMGLPDAIALRNEFCP